MPAECVKVMVRCRPMNGKEKARGCGQVVVVDSKANTIELKKPGEPDGTKNFAYDFTFGSETAQEKIYEETAFSLVESVVEGYNGTIFAYGQTGCGKTHTMAGLPNDEKEKGIIPRTFSHVMNIVNSSSDKQFLVRCSYLEIYNEEVHDLLGKDSKFKMEMKESPEKGVFIKDLTQNVVKSVQEMDKWMELGTKSRSVGETLMNKDSSRSHSIFTLFVESSMTDEKDNERFTAGKLNLVDLAGSERQSKTQATGDRLKEATKINLSLSALGNVISALVDGKSSHIPYRDSKLTRLLQDSLGGNTKTIMIAAVSPADYNYDETLSTLRYASRAKQIKNQPKVNEDPKDAMLREYADEIKKLKEMLLKQQSGQPINMQEFQLEMQKSQGLQIFQGDNDMSEKLKSFQEQMKQQVQDKEQAYEQEKREKEKLSSLVKQMEEKLMKGGTGEEGEQKKYQQMKSKLKKKEQEHQKLMDDKQKAEDEVLFLGKKYSNLQEEVTEMRTILNKIRKKYKSALQEIKDLEKEHEQQREDYLDMIRIQERDSQFIKAVVQMLLKPEELDIIRSESTYNEVEKKYIVPQFYFKQQKLKFPKIQGAVAQEIIDQEKENRQIWFKKYENNEQDFIRFNQTKVSYSAQNNDNEMRSTVPGDITNGKQNKKAKSVHEKKININVQLDPLENGPQVYDVDDSYDLLQYLDKNKVAKSQQKLQPLNHQQNGNNIHIPNYTDNNGSPEMGLNQKLESLPNDRSKSSNPKTQNGPEQGQIKRNKLQLDPID